MRGTTAKVWYRCYPDRLDLTGRDIISLAARNFTTGNSGSRADARRLFPFLAEPPDMEVRELPVEEVTL